MKTVLITGTSRRLGLYLTENFLRGNDKVIALTRSSSPELNALKQANLHIIEGDYSNLAGLAETVTQIKASHAAIDLMIHNASMFEKDERHEADKWEYYDLLCALHMRLPAYLNEALHPVLVAAAQPCIVHITDIYAENPNPAFTLYCSTKAGLENLMKSYAKKFAPKIRVNSICPGPLLFLPHNTAEEKAKVASRTLLTIEAGFEPILQGINFIYENQFVTGASFKIDGGRSIG